MTAFTYPLRAQDLRPHDAGAVVDAGDGIIGRLIQVTHSQLGSALVLEGWPYVVHIFRGDLCGVDRDTWRRLRMDADRRWVCSEGVFVQEQNEAHRVAARAHVDKFRRQIGWDEVGSPDWTVDE